ncbi:MobC family plasmid mobilization relaxosome protein [Oscillibacter sp.]|uniref:MobC family plasmid mobilization relaxosome protein n=1 Tax=Oscillibacter sp. TaxID=1945593 RepID=UPI002D7FF43B|nr:MobC family plasmid mobilization relaxosome protein [Oscillibacter sp.]
MNKDTTFSIRIASSDLDTIKNKARQARLSQSDYVTRCCLGRQVVVIEDLKEVAKQLRAIGNNLNQLTALSNMGRVSIVNLDGMTQELAGISAALREIQERGRWSR